MERTNWRLIDVWPVVLGNSCNNGRRTKFQQY